MAPTRKPTGHLTTERALDYLEGRLAAPARAEVEAHLGRPCAACRERVRDLARVVERMRLDRVPEVPAALRARALEAFPPAVRPEPKRGLAARLLELVFDSLAAPLPAAARRAVGEARRLRWSGPGLALEVEVEAEGASRATLRGRLEADEPALHRIELAAGAARHAAWPDAAGRFVFEGVPRRALRLAVSGPAGRLRTPPFEA